MVYGWQLEFMQDADSTAAEIPHNVAGLRLRAEIQEEILGIATLGKALTNRMSTVESLQS
jgi:hypothetical protein